MDETNNIAATPTTVTAAAITPTATPEVTAAAITPTATPEVTAAAITPTAAVGKSPTSRKKKDSASKSESESVAVSTKSLKEVIKKLEAIRGEIQILATTATTNTPSAVFNDIVSQLISVKGAAEASTSTLWDLYPIVQNMQNDIATILRVFEQQLELADVRYKQEEENRKELIKLLEDLNKQRPGAVKGKPDKDTNFAAIVIAGLAALVSGFIAGLIVELGAQFKGIIKVIKESKLGKAIGRFVAFAVPASIDIDSAVAGFERAWSKLKAFSRIITTKAAAFVENIKQFATRLFDPVIKLFRQIKQSPFGIKIAEMFNWLSSIGERFISKFRAGLRLIEENKFFKAIQATFTSTVEFFKSIGTKITGIGASIRNFFASLGNAWSEISTAFVSVSEKFKAAMKFVRGGEEAVGIIGTVSRWLKTFWETLRSAFNVFSELGKSLGTLAGKVFGFFAKLMAKVAIPLTIVMSIWDFFKGFTETEGDFGDKFKAGMIELVNGLVGWLFDIPKSIISWIAGAFGFTEVEKALDSFNFKDILVTAVAVGQQIFEDLFECISDLFSGGFGEVIAKIGLLIADIFLAPLNLFKMITAWVLGALGFSDLEKSLDNLFSGGFGEVLEKIGALVANIFLAPLNLFKDLASWALGVLGFGDLEKSLDDFDLGKMVVDGIESVVETITDFFEEQWKDFSGMFKFIGNLLTGKLDFGVFFKSIIAGLIKLMLAPVNQLGKLVGFDITKKALELLGLSDIGSGSADAGGVAKPAAQIAPAPNNQGATINEMATSTQAIKDQAAADNNNTSLVDASKNTNVTNNNQSVSYSGSSIPDRTSSMFVPRLGY